MPDLLGQIETALAGRYQIERELGHGGMAIVYLAHDQKLGRQVALKVLRRELAAALGTERFLREIEIAAGLNHPNILPLHDCGEAAGLLYYTMPYVEGESLRARLTHDKQLPVEAALQIAGEIADALGHAHGRGLVHRDVKPENILLVGGHALLADFGIARAVSAAGVETLTETGLAVGTPAYMSPEQASGSRDLDGRSDLYSLGCVLYEMLAGEPPYTAPSAQGIVAKKLGLPTPRISVVRETVPDGIDAALQCALAKTPADRFATAAEFSEALRRGTGVSRRAGPRGRRWPLVAVAAVAAVIVATLGTSWLLRTGRPGTLIGSGAIDSGARILLGDFVNRTDDSTLAGAVWEGMWALLTDSRLVRLVDRAAVRRGLARMGRPATSRLDESLTRELAERENAPAFLTGEVSRLGSAYQFTARVVATLDGRELLVARAMAENEAEVMDAVDRLGSRVRRGIGESLLDDVARPSLQRVSTPSLPALRAYSSAVHIWPDSRSIGLLQQAIALDTSFASAYRGLALALYAMSRPEEAKAASEAAYRHRDHLPEKERLLVEAIYHGDRGEFQASELAWRRLVDLDPLHRFGLISISDIRLRQRRYAEAESLALLAIPMATVSAGYGNALEARLALGRDAAAESLLTEVRPAWRPGLELMVRMAQRDWDRAEAVAKARGDDHHLRALLALRGKLAQDVSPLGFELKWWPLQLLRYTGDTARALRAADAWRVREGWDTLPPGMRQYWILIPTLAEAGRLTEARHLLGEWKTQVPDDPTRPALIGWSAGEIALAEGHPDSAAAAFLAWHGHLYPGSATTLSSHGLAEAGMAMDRAGRTDTALVLYQRALAIPSLDAIHYEATWYPLVLRRLGQLHDSLHHRQQAIDYYGRFIDLWKDADPDLQPQVDAVRSALARLTEEPRL